MKIQHKETSGGGEFFAEENGKNFALMTYKKSGAEKTMTIDHTEVDESLQGRGIGKDLVAEGVKFARANNLKIVAQCPFAAKVIDETTEFQDVLSV